MNESEPGSCVDLRSDVCTRDTFGPTSAETKWTIGVDSTIPAERSETGRERGAAQRLQRVKGRRSAHPNPNKTEPFPLSLKSLQQATRVEVGRIPSVSNGGLFGQRP